MKFKIIHLESVEESTICDLSELSQKLSPNSEILQIFDNGSLEAIGFVSQETLVGFTIDFAQYALDNYCPKDKVDARSTEALIVARRYLKKQASLQEVKAAYVAANAANAAYAAYAAANAAYAAAADAAADAAYAAAAAAAYAAYAATNAATYAAANAAVHAAAAATYAAAAAATYAAANAAAPNKHKEQNRQGNFILSFFQEE